MPTKAKKASAAGVSRALIDGGMTKSQSESTRIRGYRHVTAGFRAQNETEMGEPVRKTKWVRGQGSVEYTDRPWLPTGVVRVEWTDGAFPRGESPRDVELAKAETILKDKGYEVTWEDEFPGSNRKVLKVHRPDA